MTLAVQVCLSIISFHVHFTWGIFFYLLRSFIRFRLLKLADGIVRNYTTNDATTMYKQLANLHENID